MVGLLPTCRTMPVCTNERNPGKLAASLYGPSNRFGNAYDPVSFVMVVRLTPVSVCVAVISAPGNTAPLGSCTVPLICAVACAQTLLQVIADTQKPRHKAAQMRFIFSSSQARIKDAL